MWLKHEATRGNAAAQVKTRSTVLEILCRDRPGHAALTDSPKPQWLKAVLAYFLLP